MKLLYKMIKCHQHDSYLNHFYPWHQLMLLCYILSKILNVLQVQKYTWPPLTSIPWQISCQWAIASVFSKAYRMPWLHQYKGLHSVRFCWERCDRRDFVVTQQSSLYSSVVVNLIAVFISSPFFLGSFFMKVIIFVSKTTAPLTAQSFVYV